MLRYFYKLTLEIIEDWSECIYKYKNYNYIKINLLQANKMKKYC